MEKLVKGFDLKIVMAFAAVYIIWGTTYLAIKIGLENMSPFIMAFFRYLIAGVLLLFWGLVKRSVVLDKHVLKNMLLGAFMLTLGQGVLFWAEQYLSSGLTAVFIATLPICYILVDRRNWKGYFQSKLTLASILIGFFGIFLLFNGQTVAPGQHAANMTVIASFVVIGSCICWAIGSLYYKNNMAAGSLFTNVAWQLIGGAIACFFIGFMTGEWTVFRIDEIDSKSWTAVLYLSVAGSIIAFTASYYLLANRPAAVVGTYAYVNPIIAVLLGCLLAEEVISTIQIIGIAIILMAAYLANKVKMEM